MSDVIKNRRLAWLRWAGTLLSVTLFAWLLARQNWATAWERLAALSPLSVALALSLYLLAQAFNSLRWCILLWARDVKIGYLQAFRIGLAGSFASNFLPSTIGGDGFRLLAVYPFTNSKTLAFGAVALDRLINMAAMACLLPVPLTLFGTGAFSLNLAVLPPGLTRLAERYFPKIIQAVHDWAARPAAFGWAFLAAWPSNLLPMAASYTLARALGIEVTYWQVVAVQTVTYFLSLLPISVNGLGVREMAYTSLYAALGATIEQASGLALLSRLLTTLLTLPGALWLTGATDELGNG